ncbi:MAG: nuclear transport factor 2 family protein [Deltaproteobacteria bacterium]|nr:nuclear transport factor 2 family protein [Deltaproteobacteria bacterium]
MRRAVRGPWIATLALASWACAKSNPAPPAPGAEPSAAVLSAPEAATTAVHAAESATEAVAPAEAPSPVALPPAPSVTEAEVRGLLDLWLAAQNQGDFATYQGLYAARMTGVRRVGTVRRQFSRAGWMADRKRMFGKAMRVQVQDVQMAIAAGIGQVRFVQTFETGTFRDKGPKAWMVAKQFDTPRIVREEMLGSVVAPGEPALPPPAEQLALAMRVGASIWLTIDAVPSAVDASPTLAQQGGVWAAAAPLDWSGARMPWKDRDVVVYGQTGEVCRGQVVEVAAIARAVPHFGQVQDWTEGPVTRRPAADAIARAVWDLGKGDAVTAVRVQPYGTPGNRSDCPKALFGRFAQLAAPRFLGRDDTKAGQLRETALATLRAERAFADIQRIYSSEVEPPRALTWDQYQHAVTQVVSFEGRGVRLVVTRAQAGEPCGGFWGSHLAIWTARPRPPDNYTLLLASDPAAGGEVLPEAAVDVDGDGRYELVAPDRVWRQVGPAWRPVRTWTVPDYDCPC